ncbi:hypothetical protein ACP70R_049042 [Stipagrostis hirtigluma subsp. patula]
MDEKKRSTPTPPAGAILFLQIFYLDNIAYGNDTTDMTTTPRFKIFNQKLLSRLVMADTVGLKGPNPSRVFGAGKLCADQDVLYKRKIGANWNSKQPNQPTNGKRSRANDISATNGSPGLIQVAEDENIVGHSGVRSSRAAQVDETRKQILIKAYKAKCLKVLTQARLSIERETDKLVEEIVGLSLHKSIVHSGPIRSPTAGPSPCTPPATPTTDQA